MGEYKRAKFEAFENAVPPDPLPGAPALSCPIASRPITRLVAKGGMAVPGSSGRALGPSIRKTADSDFFQSLSSNFVPPSQCYGPTFVKSEGP